MHVLYARALHCKGGHVWQNGVAAYCGRLWGTGLCTCMAGVSALAAACAIELLTYSVSGALQISHLLDALQDCKSEHVTEMLILQDEIDLLRQEQSASQCSPSPAWSVSQDEYHQLESRNEELREKVAEAKSYE